MWIEAIVMPREESKPYRPSPRDRRAVYEASCAESLQFRDAVMEFLRAHHLMGAVKWISEPGSLPMVTLHCKAQVLEQLQRAPQFEAGRSASLSVVPEPAMRMDARPPRQRGARPSQTRGAAPP